MWTCSGANPKYLLRLKPGSYFWCRASATIYRDARLPPATVAAIADFRWPDSEVWTLWTASSLIFASVWAKLPWVAMTSSSLCTWLSKTGRPVQWRCYVALVANPNNCCCDANEKGEEQSSKTLLHAVDIRTAMNTEITTSWWENWNLATSQVSLYISPGRYSVASCPVATTWCSHLCHDYLLYSWSPSNDVTAPRQRANGTVDAGLWLDYHQRTSAVSRWSSTKFN